MVHGRQLIVRRYFADGCSAFPKRLQRSRRPYPHWHLSASDRLRVVSPGKHAPRQRVNAGAARPG
ncbi:hypothetical protein MKSMC1_48990 [Mycobacterium kansasii]|nr:hypothetical protein MKSMC1_48990 [Mycobacterium kansasii]